MNSIENPMKKEIKSPIASKIKILITGANSYIGTSFAGYMAKNAPGIQVDTISLRGENWRQLDFSSYTTIFHVAGIAHADVAGASKEQEEEYYRVNRDLTIECAKKAKDDGVSQFIFMSSIIVYGDGARLGKKRVITKDTPLSPAGFYGDSKKQAEEGLLELNCDSFRVCILRPPMIYGPGSKGNYPQLSKMARKLPVFPLIKNQRSMLYVDNLCRFVELCVQNRESGIFFPQNKSYVSTSTMVQEIAACYGKNIRLSRSFFPLLVILSGLSETEVVQKSRFILCRLLKKAAGLSNKAFGNLVYDKSLSSYKDNYQICGFKESIRRTECPEEMSSNISDAKLTSSVITVCYNAREQLPKTIESVLNQTKVPDEYLIIDGASVDGSALLAEEYREKLEAKGIRFVVVSEPDKGIYNAMNKGIRLSSGDLVSILNAGDTYEPIMIEETRKAFVEKRCDACFGDIQIVRPDGSSFIKKARLRRFQTSRNWNHPTMTVKRELALQNPFLEKGIHDDYGFYLGLVARGCHIVTIPETLASFTMGGASNKKGFKEARRRILDRYKYCYQVNGFSPLYMLECIFIEGIKALL